MKGISVKNAMGNEGKKGEKGSIWGVWRVMYIHIEGWVLFNTNKIKVFVVRSDAF